MFAEMLSGSDIQIIKNALHVAVGQYLEDAATQRKAGVPRLEEGFLKQAEDAQRLLDRLEDEL